MGGIFALGFGPFGRYLTFRVGFEVLLLRLAAVVNHVLSRSLKRNCRFRLLPGFPTTLIRCKQLFEYRFATRTKSSKLHLSLLHLRATLPYRRCHDPVLNGNELTFRCLSFSPAIHVRKSSQLQSPVTKPNSAVQSDRRPSVNMKGISWTSIGSCVKTNRDSNVILVAVCFLCAVNVLPPALVCATQAPACRSESQQSAILNFFIHDDFDVQPRPSAITVLPGLANTNGAANSNLFGAIAVLDDSITTGPDVSSTEIARGRGFYVFDHLASGGTSLEFVITAIFNSDSDYDGSTLTMRGYDKIDDTYRELAVTGGTGIFRLARGWAGIYTYSLHGGAAVLNTTCYVYYGCYYESHSTSAGSRGLPLSWPIAIMFSLGACIFLAAVRYRRVSHR